MNNLVRALALMLALAWPTLSSAQGVVKQAGAATFGHPAVFQSNGLIMDGGGPTAPTLNSVGLYGGSGCPFGIASLTGPGSSTGAYSVLTICQSDSTTTFKVRGVNGQATPTIQFDIGGTLYPFPGSGGGIAGPVSSVSGNLVSWNGITGSVVADSGIAARIAANSLLGNSTGSTTTMAAISVPDCHTANQALNWTAATGFTCQTITGGGSGSVTSVATGAGLTGGPITATGTIAATTLVNAQIGTTYTVLSSDSAGIVTLSNGSAIAVTLLQATGSFGAGFATTLCNIGAGTATITPTTSTIGGASTYTLTTGNCVTPISDGSNYQVVSSTGQNKVNATTSYSLNSVLLASATAPVVASGFGTSAAVANANGTAAFTIGVGTSNSGTGVVTMPAAAHGWACSINDITTKSTTVATTQVSATGTTSVTVQNYSDVMATHAWVDSDVLQFICSPY